MPGGMTLERPLLVGNSPFLLVFTCALSVTGQPVFRWQDEFEIKNKPKKAHTKRIK
jgi:hypothetical protein